VSELQQAVGFAFPVTVKEGVRRFVEW